MRKLSLLLVLACLAGTLTAQNYFPPRNQWESKDPTEMGLNQQALNKAVQYAEENEYAGSEDLRIAILEGFRSEPYHKILGPTKKRGGAAGMIIKDGYIVAEWGDVNRVDMTFSVTKSYLSTMAGLAVDEGLIRSTQDKVNEYVWDQTFWGEHNSKISWHHLLNQSSAWTGELFGIKDWADRPPRNGGIDDWRLAVPREPGTFMEYNDVRVNVLAYSLLQVWRKPLPQVLKEKIMDPIGASTTWRWFGYENALWMSYVSVKLRLCLTSSTSHGCWNTSHVRKTMYQRLFAAASSLIVACTLLISIVFHHFELSGSLPYLSPRVRGPLVSLASFSSHYSTYYISH